MELKDIYRNQWGNIKLIQDDDGMLESQSVESNLLYEILLHLKFIIQNMEILIKD